MVPFIVATTQRSGSTFFESCLRSHPDISCYGEFLYDKGRSTEGNFYAFWCEKIQKDHQYIEAVTSVHDRVKLFNEYLNEVFFNRPEAFIGGDVKYGQEFPMMWDILRNHSFKVIQLVRYNYLKCYVSRLVNNMKNQTGRRAHERERVAVFKVSLPINELLDEIEKISRQTFAYNKMLKSLFGDNFLQISYELFFEDNREDGRVISDRTSNDILSFLGIKESKHKFKGELKKLNPSDLSEFVTNYDEVFDKLSNTKWAFLLTNKKTELITGWQAMSQQYSFGCESIYDDFTVEEFYYFQKAIEQCLNKRWSHIVLYGAGMHSRKLLPVLEFSKLHVVSILDEFTSGCLAGHEIVRPNSYDFSQVDGVIISSKAYQTEIFQLLQLKGVATDKIVRIYDT